MGVVIRTSIFPLRAKFRDKEPFELNIELENEDQSQKKITVTIDLPEQVSFSTVGLTNRYEKQYESFKGKEKISLKLPVYQSNSTEEGQFMGKVVAEEHIHDFGYHGKTYKKPIPFRIVG